MTESVPTLSGLKMLHGGEAKISRTKTFNQSKGGHG